MRCALVPTVLVILIAAALPAAPILGKKRMIPDDQKSLAGLREVRVHVSPLRSVLKSLDVRKAKIEALFRQELEASGFKIVTDTAAPRCVLRVVGQKDDRFPDAVSIITVIEIEQRVTVHRIEQDLTFATATFMDVFLAHKSEVSKTVKQKIPSSVAFLAKATGSATYGG